MTKKKKEREISLIVIETPESCQECPCAYWTEGAASDYCMLGNREMENVCWKNRPDWCPLITVTPR